MENVAEKVKALIADIVPDLYIGDFPSLGGEGVAIRLNSGTEMLNFFSAGVSPRISKPTLLLVARSANYSTAQRWLEDIRRRVDRYVEPGGLLGIFLQEPPTYAGRDEQKLHEFQVTYSTLIKE